MLCLNNLIYFLGRSDYYNFHFLNRQTKAQRSGFLVSYSQEVPKMRSELHSASLYSVQACILEL